MTFAAADNALQENRSKAREAGSRIPVLTSVRRVSRVVDEVLRSTPIRPYRYRP